MAEDKEIETDLKKRKANTKEIVAADPILPVADEDTNNDLYTTTIDSLYTTTIDSWESYKFKNSNSIQISIKIISIYQIINSYNYKNDQLN